MRHAVACLVAALLALAAGVAAAAEVAAGVIFATGSTTIAGADGAIRPATRGGDLFAGETVDTGSDGRAQLKFRDGASLSLQPATRFRVDDYRFTGNAEAAGPADRGFFSLLKGGFRTISGLIGKVRREQYRVGTVVATIGIRGTEYSARLGDDGLLVSTFAGLVEVCNDVGCVQVAPGQSALATAPDRKPELRGGAGVGVDAAGLLPQLQQPGGGEEPRAPAAGNVPSQPAGMPATRGATNYNPSPAGNYGNSPTGRP